jgi:Protein of unknown function with HXXEE motif
MPRRVCLAFLILVLAQTAHSIEEYSTRLYEIFAPARFLSGLLTQNHAVGFVIINLAINALGYWLLFITTRRESSTARIWLWGWAVVELANGAAHLTFAALRGAYFSGAATAPLLIAAALVLVTQLKQSRDTETPPH